MVKKIAGVLVEGSFGRGFILSRHLKALVESQRSFEAALTAEEQGGSPQNVQKLLDNAARWEAVSLQVA